MVFLLWLDYFVTIINVDSKTASANQTEEDSENQGIDNQHLLNDPSDICTYTYVCETIEVELETVKEKDQSPSVSCKPNMATHGSKKVNSAYSKSHSKGKKRKLTDYVKTDKKSQQASNIPNGKVIDSEDNSTNKRGKEGKIASSEIITVPRQNL